MSPFTRSSCYCIFWQCDREKAAPLQAATLALLAPIRPSTQPILGINHVKGSTLRDVRIKTPIANLDSKLGGWPVTQGLNVGFFRPGLAWKPRLWLGLWGLRLSKTPGRAKAKVRGLALAWSGFRPWLFQSQAKPRLDGFELGRQYFVTKMYV